MKLKILLVLSVVAVLALGTVTAVNKIHLQLTGAEGSGKVEIRSTKSHFGPHNTYVLIGVRDLVQPPGKIFEGWLVDMDSDTKLSLGTLSTNRFGHGKLKFHQMMVNFDIFDKVVITEEFIDDVNPAPGPAVLEAEIPGSMSGTVFEMKSHLDGKQEVPPSGSDATGMGTFTIDTDANTLTYNIEYSDLEGVETAAHIHGLAPKGQNAGVLHVLPLGSPKVGVFNYDEADEDGILAGHTYINVHTDLYPPGEIRGQIYLS